MFIDNPYNPSEEVDSADMMEITEMPSDEVISEAVIFRTLSKS